VKKFSGYNKPKRTPSNAKKSHAVLAKAGDKVKLIRFGQQGVSGAGSNPTTKKEKHVASLSKHDMEQTLRKVRCQQPTGLIKLSGKDT